MKTPIVAFQTDRNLYVVPSIDRRARTSASISSLLKDRGIEVRGVARLADGSFRPIEIGRDGLGFPAACGWCGSEPVSDTRYCSPGCRSNATMAGLNS